MDINLVKNVINGVNLVEIGHFGENGQQIPIFHVSGFPLPEDENFNVPNMD